MTVTTKDFKFLDILYYLAPGYNLNKFLKAYNAGSGKQDFPYEFLQSVDQLTSKVFPNYEDFYSNLRMVNTLDTELTEFNRHVLKGVTVQRALSLMGIDAIPLSGPEKHARLQTMFYDNDWDMADYLAFYNNQGK